MKHLNEARNGFYKYSRDEEEIKSQEKNIVEPKMIEL
jgi:hypothetical protein